jgi:hypothetical protein
MKRQKKMMGLRKAKVSRKVEEKKNKMTKKPHGRRSGQLFQPQRQRGQKKQTEHFRFAFGTLQDDVARGESRVRPKTSAFLAADVSDQLAVFLVLELISMILLSSFVAAVVLPRQEYPIQSFC